MNKVIFFNYSSEGTATPSSNKEVKKRRLDELLSKKFSVTDSPPHSSESNRATPSNTSDGGVAIDHSPMRRDSTEKRHNRRKRSSPQSCTSSSSPITLAVRPNSELLMAEARMAEAKKAELAEINRRPVNTPEEDDDDKSAMKNQILQLHLAQAALMNQTSLFPGFPGFPGMPGAGNSPGNNPLLYYGYYAQMIQGLQSQQQKLLDQLTGKTKNNVLPSISKVRTNKTDNFQFKFSKVDDRRIFKITASPQNFSKPKQAIWDD